MKNNICCGRYDCKYNSNGCQCDLPTVAIGKDLRCQNYNSTLDDDIITKFETDYHDTYIMRNEYVRDKD